MRRFTPLIPLLLITGCTSPLEVSPVKGGSFVKEEKVVTTYDVNTSTPISVVSTKTVTVQQSENPDSNTVLETREGGETKVTLGTGNPNSIVLPPATDYTKYITLAVSALMVALGIVCISKGLTPGTKAAGYRFTIFGAVGMIVAMTVSSYGYLYVIAVLALGVYAALDVKRAHTISSTPT